MLIVCFFFLCCIFWPTLFWHWFCTGNHITCKTAKPVLLDMSGDTWPPLFILWSACTHTHTGNSLSLSSLPQGLLLKVKVCCYVQPSPNSGIPIKGNYCIKRPKVFNFNISRATSPASKPRPLLVRSRSSGNVRNPLFLHTDIWVVLHSTCSASEDMTQTSFRTCSMEVMIHAPRSSRRASWAEKCGCNLNAGSTVWGRVVVGRKEVPCETWEDGNRLDFNASMGKNDNPILLLRKRVLAFHFIIHFLPHHIGMLLWSLHLLI